MAWATLTSTITGAMTTAGYTRIPDNSTAGNETNAVHKNKGYSLEVLGFDEREFTSGKNTDSYLVQLKVSYKCANTTEYDTIIGYIESLKGVVEGLAGYVGFAENNKIEKLDNKQVIFTMLFYIGIININ